jgi:glycogen synthase
MRVAHLVRAIFPQHGYGGMERAATALHTGMLEAGLDVTLLTRRPPEPAPEWRVEWREEPFGPHGVVGQVIGVPYSLLPLRPNSVAARLSNYPLFVDRMGRETQNLARREGLDIVYAHGLCAYGVRAPGRRRSRGGVAPLVMNPHGLEDFKVTDPLKRLAYAPFRAMYMRGAQAADRVIATDESLRAEVARFLRVPARRIRVIPNGVDPQAGPALVSAARQEALRARLQLPAGVYVGLTVARLEANKGLPDLLRALAALDPALDWRWVIVGAGGDRAPLEALARRLGVAARVRFAGGVGEVDLHNLYALAGGFALPSLYEGSSLATLEAMAHGLPVVATRVGGLPDKVRPGETGLLVAPGDAPALSAALARLMSDADAAAAMGRAGAALVQERFTWAAITAQTIALFEELKSSSS